MRSAARLAKAGYNVFNLDPVWGPAMQAIGMIATFLVVILALNFYEFGRGD